MSETTYQANSVINQVLEAVIGLMNACTPFDQVTRGALPTHHGISVELDPSSPLYMHMDKNTVVPLNVVLNAKHPDMMLLLDTLNNIHGALTRARSYPAATAWQIVDINEYSSPRLIGREDNNDWLAAGALTVKFYWRGMINNAESQS